VHTVINIVVVFVPLLIAVILHEISHGLVAERLGDPTARRLKRITLNPIRHIDPVMTIVLPVVLALSNAPIIGGAKPVPIDPRYFRNPRKGMLWVALAGPGMNFVLAALHYLLLWGLNTFGWNNGLFGTLLSVFLAYSVLINIVLAVFNLLPIPPLDGGRIAVGLLPLKIARMYGKIERFGILLVFVLLFSGTLDYVLRPVLTFVEQQLEGLVRLT
jgi:Zn-dependent protease